MPLPKPAYGSPCNFCGRCCEESLCVVAERAFPGATAPCPALTPDGNKLMCGLVMIEREAGLEPMIRRVLGIGCGCSMPDESTTDAEIDRFDRESRAKVYGPIQAS